MQDGGLEALGEEAAPKHEALRTNAWRGYLVEKRWKCLPIPVARSVSPARTRCATTDARHTFATVHNVPGKIRAAGASASIQQVPSMTLG